MLTWVFTMMACSENGPRKLVAKCMAPAPRTTSATSRRVRERLIPTMVGAEQGEGKERRRAKRRTGKAEAEAGRAEDRYIGVTDMTVG